MHEHLRSIKNIYGEVGVRIPNSIFRDLSKNIKSNNGRSNIQQVAFAYAYIATISFLYKYSYFVDKDNGTYLQNGDIKEILGYNRKTKTIDRIIKKDGVLDSLGITRTTDNYPVQFNINKEEEINGISIHEFTYINHMNKDDIYFKLVKNIVKNRNYEIKEPVFLIDGYGDSDFGTLYSIEKTHKVDISELLYFIDNDGVDNIDFLLYCFFKSKCKGYKNNMKSLALYKITLELGISNDTFYSRLELLKDKKFVSVHHKNWKKPIKDRDDLFMEANKYFFIGIKK